MVKELANAFLDDMDFFNNKVNCRKNTSAVKQTIEAVLPDREVRIIPIENCDQFYLPKEL